MTRTNTKQRIFVLFLAAVLCLVLLTVTARGATTWNFDGVSSGQTAQNFADWCQGMHGPAPNNGDTAKLTGNFSYDRSVILAYDMTIDLNGHIILIEASGHANGFKIEMGKTLTIVDSVGGGKLTVANISPATSMPIAGLGAGINTSQGTLIIDSGTVVASGSLDGAGIGGGKGEPGGTIIINGGCVVATGFDFGAGIGGGINGSGGNITINGGTVTAKTMGSGAGIGGGTNGSGGNITISGGVVTATASTTLNPDFGGGAGIGGGNGGNGGNILIEGTAQVAATGGQKSPHNTIGGDGGAGIGGGGGSAVLGQEANAGSAGTIIIKDSVQVTAIGKGNAAGIGGGGHSLTGVPGKDAAGGGGTVTISGTPTVNATGDGNGAGIGGGGNGVAGPAGIGLNLTISGGTVTVQGGATSLGAIGGGTNSTATAGAGGTANFTGGTLNITGDLGNTTLTGAGQVSLKVVNNSGVGIAGVTVSDGTHTAKTDASGEVKLLLLDATYATFTASKAGHVTNTVPSFTVASAAQMLPNLMLLLEPLSITTASLPNATVGTAYSQTIAATGGDGSYTFSITGNPAWLSINAATGALTGTPAIGDVGAVNITVAVDDTSATPLATKTLSFTVSVTPPAPPSGGGTGNVGNNGNAQNQSYSVTGNGQSYTGQTSGLTFTIDAPYSSFVGITGLTSGTHFISRSGSTIVTLLPAYLDTLSNGNHSVTANFSNGSAALRFSVTNQSGGVIPISVYPYGQGQAPYAPSVTPTPAAIFQDTVDEGTEEATIEDSGDDTTTDLQENDDGESVVPDRDAVKAPKTGDQSANILPALFAGMIAMIGAVTFVIRKRAVK